MVEGVTVSESMGIGGWFGDTASDGASAICKTVCSPCMLLFAMILVFYGEYNYVKDLNNIYTINQDMVPVTGYDAANDGLPVVYTANVTAPNMNDLQFGLDFGESLGYQRSAYILRTTVSERKENNRKITSCNPTWSTSKGTQGNACNQGTYNTLGFKSPCPSDSCGASVTADTATVGVFTGTSFLNDDYIGRTAGTAVDVDYSSLSPSIQANWDDCGVFLGASYSMTNCRSRSQGTGGTAAFGDQTVEWDTYPPPALATVCSRQATGATFEKLYNSEWYDIMKSGTLTQQDCIDIMHAEAKAIVWMFRIISFICFWAAFYMLFSIVTFLADRVGQLIPCGIGQAFEDMVDCIVCCATCPPACMCWLLWFGLAWMIFRPMIGGPIFAGCLLLGCCFGYYTYTREPKEKPMKDPESQYPQVQQEAQQAPQTQQQQQGGWMGGMMNQFNQAKTNFQNAQPYGQQQANSAPPPPAFQQQNPYMQDADGNGVPDMYETNLPPGFEARVDPGSGRVYWVNHNNHQSQWHDPRMG